MTRAVRPMVAAFPLPPMARSPAAMEPRRSVVAGEGAADLAVDQAAAVLVAAAAVLVAAARDQLQALECACLNRRSSCEESHDHNDDEEAARKA